MTRNKRSFHSPNTVLPQEPPIKLLYHLAFIEFIRTASILMWRRRCTFSRGYYFVTT